MKILDILVGWWLSLKVKFEHIVLKFFALTMFSVMSIILWNRIVDISDKLCVLGGKEILYK